MSTVFLLLAVCIVAHTVATGGEDDGSSVLHIHLSIHRCRRRVECGITGHTQKRETHRMHANPLWRDTEKKQHSLGNIIKGPGGKETKLRRHNPRWQFRFRVHVQLNFQKVCDVGKT